MRIKKAWIDYAEKHGACEEALKWLRKRPRTIKELVEYTPAAYSQGYIWLDFALNHKMLPVEARVPARAALRAYERKY